MSSSMVWATILLGAVISLLLVRFILKKWRIIKAADAAGLAYEKSQREKRQEIIDSIKIIAKCMSEGQVELSEGCIRIKVLLDHVDPTLHEQAPFSIFSTMYKATEHMPTHEARKKTDKKFIHKLDQQRFKLERDNKEAILSASEAIQIYPF